MEPISAAIIGGSALLGGILGGSRGPSAAEREAAAASAAASRAQADLIGDIRRIASNELVSRPYQAYGGQREAPFNADQLRAFEAARGVSGMMAPLMQSNLQLADPAYSRMRADRADTALGRIDQANGDTRQVWQNMAPNFDDSTNAIINAGRMGRGVAESGVRIANQAPGVVSSGVQNIGELAERFPEANIRAYQNPYTEAVLEPSQRDLLRRAANARYDINDRSAATRSFGGSRNAIAQGMNERNYLEESGRLDANTRMASFEAAANRWDQDRQRLPQMYAQQVGLLGAGVGVQNAALQGLAGMQGLEENAQDAIQRTIDYRQIPADIERRMVNDINSNIATRGNLVNLNNSAAGGVSQMFNAGFQPLMQVGGMQQNLDQRTLDRQYADWLEARDWDRNETLTRLGALQGASGSASRVPNAPSPPNATAQGIGAGLGIGSQLANSGVGNWLGSQFSGWMGSNSLTTPAGRAANNGFSSNLAAAGSGIGSYVDPTFAGAIY